LFLYKLARKFYFSFVEEREKERDKERQKERRKYRKYILIFNVQ